MCLYIFIDNGGIKLLLGDVFHKIDERKLVLPDFQRDLEWTKNQQKDLIASVLLGLPIGSVLLLEGVSDDFSSKRIGYSKMVETPADECLYLLDGQQRITSLMSSFCDFYSKDNWKNVMDEVYPVLKNRLFLRVNTSENEEDIFGYENLVFDKDLFRKQDPIAFENRLIHESIGKTLTNKWCNPGAIFKEVKINSEDSEEKKKKKNNSYFEKECARRCYIPLYCLFKDDETKTIKNIMNQIANQRVGEIKTEIGDDIDLIVKYLEAVDIDIQENIDELTQFEIDSLWLRLSSTWATDVCNYLEKILTLDVPVIQLKSDEIGRAVIIFENINRGGTKLSNFDLVVARAARNKGLKSLSLRLKDSFENTIHLPDSLTTRISMSSLRPKNLNISKMIIKDGNINDAIKNQYLNLLSIYCKELNEDIDYKLEIANHKTDLIGRQRILSLTHNEINDNTDIVLKGLKRACLFLNVRCGVAKIEDLQYKLILLPLAIALIDDNVWLNESLLNKLEAWYWMSIFGGAYSKNQNERCLKDVNTIRYFLFTDQNIYSNLKQNLFNVQEYCDENTLLNLNEKPAPSAVHKILLQYILTNCPRDFLDNTYLTSWSIMSDEIKVEDHHIRPLKTASSIGQSSSQLRKKPDHPLNSILNRTYILSSTNRTISDMAVEKYISELDHVNLSQHFIKKGDYLTNKKYEKETDLYSDEIRLRYERFIDRIHEEINTLLN